MTFEPEVVARTEVRRRCFVKEAAPAVLLRLVGPGADTVAAPITMPSAEENRDRKARTLV